MLGSGGYYTPQNHNSTGNLPKAWAKDYGNLGAPSNAISQEPTKYEQPVPVKGRNLPPLNP